MRPRKIAIFFFVLLLYSCVQNKGPENKKQSSNQLLKIDYHDSIFRYRRNYDTLLTSGWSISYLVKDDSTKYNDIYIKVIKAKDSSIYFGPELLTFRDYFVPIFSRESEHFIFFEEGCATSCRGVLVFNKKSLQFKVFTQIIDYSEKMNKIVWLSNENLSDGKPFSIQLTDLLKEKDTTIQFKNFALGSIKDDYIDSVIFNENNTIINCTLIDKNDYYRKREIKESRKVKL
jgi:hypothetical protein